VGWRASGSGTELVGVAVGRPVA